MLLPAARLTYIAQVNITPGVATEEIENSKLLAVTR
jgi:hypothetical protein